MIDLPQVYNRREAKKTPEVMELLEETCAFEVKQTKTNTLPANSLAVHQYKALMAVHNGTYKHKIADMGRRNPFDGFVLKQEKAVVVIIFGGGEMISIDIADFPPIDRKITKDEALLIGRRLK